MKMAMGIVSALVGMVLSIIGAIETINVSTGVWTPLKRSGEAMGAGVYIILLCVGVALLVGGVVLTVKTIKSKKN